jgi:hypothetical protein
MGMNFVERGWYGCSAFVRNIYFGGLLRETDRFLEEETEGGRKGPGCFGEECLSRVKLKRALLFFCEGGTFLVTAFKRRLEANIVEWGGVGRRVRWMRSLLMALTLTSNETLSG